MIAVVVDDSSAMRRIQQRAMQSLGWEVHVAVDGKDALEVISRLPGCDLVLTDWHMPEMDGLALTAALRARSADLRILVATSDSVLDSVERALAAGANDVILKPFTAETLSARVSEVMGG